MLASWEKLTYLLDRRPLDLLLMGDICAVRLCITKVSAAGACAAAHNVFIQPWEIG
jgi:hypothetical protein